MFQFSYDGDKVYLGGEWKYDGTGLHKVSVHVTPDLVSIVQVVGDTHIFELVLGDKKISLKYELPQNISEVIDF